MQSNKTISALMISLLTVLVMASCADLADDEHYKLPAWAKGNAYEMMQGEGVYSTFLRGLQLTGNDGIVNGKSIVTVMAPDDNAFDSFLKSKGYNSIDEMYAANPDYVKGLIGMHLMYYAFDWNKMVNFRPDDGDGATEEQKAVFAGYYYKHRTHSQDAIEKVTIDGTEQEVYHDEKFLPVFSTKMFETKGIDAATNYNYFYPTTTWFGSENEGDGFNIANAKVSNTDNIITDNGYLYKVDRVIEPLKTIYDELRNNSDYSQFLSIYDEYLTYQLARTDVTDALGRNVYVREHGNLPPIACEWPVGATYMSMNRLEHDGYNVFAPTNQALDNFFHGYWSKEQGYGSLADLDPLIKQYFIFQMFAESTFIVFPEEIENGKVQTSYGTPINFDPQSISQERRRICCNGVLYGMDEMTAPAIFSSVVAPAFRDTTYSYYLYCLDGSGLVSPLAAENSTFVTLIPSNDQFRKSDPAITLVDMGKTRQLQVWNDESAQFVEMGNSAKLSIVNIHTADAVSELPTSGKRVVNTSVPFNYWYVKDGEITTNALFNNQLEIDAMHTDNPYVAFHETKPADGSEWSNGKAYTYDAPSIFKAQSGDGLLSKLSKGNDSNLEYYYYAQLLKLAGLVSGTYVNLGGDYESDNLRYVIFAPTNEVVKQHLKEIPGCDKLSFNADGSIKGTLTAANKALLGNWLRACCVSTDKNQISDYPFPGSSCKGNFVNNDLTTLSIYDNGTSLSVSLNGGETVSVTDKYSYFPFAFSDACLHFVDALLK